MSNLMGLAYLLETQEQTRTTTRSVFAGLAQEYPSVVDVFFKLPYFLGNMGDPETPEGGFRSITSNHYQQIPYTFWEIYDLMEKGSYLECGILFRYVLDTFITARYFHRYPEKYEDHLTVKKLIPIKRMLDEFSGGFYQPYYGRMLSGMAHGGVSSQIFRVKYSSPTKGEIIYGSQFDEWAALAIFNQVPAFMFGFVNYFPRFFPENKLSPDSEVSAMVDWVKEWLEQYMRDHKTRTPRSAKWYKHVDKFIR